MIDLPSSIKIAAVAKHLNREAYIAGEAVNSTGDELARAGALLLFAHVSALRKQRNQTMVLEDIGAHMQAVCDEIVAQYAKGGKELNIP